MLWRKLEWHRNWLPQRLFVQMSCCCWWCWCWQMCVGEKKPFPTSPPPHLPQYLVVRWPPRAVVGCCFVDRGVNWDHRIRYIWWSIVGWKMQLSMLFHVQSCRHIIVRISCYLCHSIPWVIFARWSKLNKQIKIWMVECCYDWNGITRPVLMKLIMRNEHFSIVHAKISANHTYRDGCQSRETLRCACSMLKIYLDHHNWVININNISG